MDIPPCAKKLSFVGPSYISANEMEQHELRQRAKSFHALRSETPITSLMHLSQGITNPTTQWHNGSAQHVASSTHSTHKTAGHLSDMDKQIVQLQDGRPRAKSFISRRQKSKRSREQEIQFLGEIRYPEYFGKRSSSFSAASHFDVSMLNDSLSNIDFQQGPVDLSSVRMIFENTVRKYRQFLYFVYQNIWYSTQMDFLSSCSRQLQIPSNGDFPVPSRHECQSLLQLSEKMRITETQNLQSTTNYNYYAGLPTMDSYPAQVNFPINNGYPNPPPLQYPTMPIPGRKLGTCVPPQGWSSGMLADFLAQVSAISETHPRGFSRKRPIEQMSTTEYLYFQMHESYLYGPPQKIKGGPIWNGQQEAVFNPTMETGMGAHGYPNISDNFVAQIAPPALECTTMVSVEHSLAAEQPSLESDEPMVVGPPVLEPIADPPTQNEDDLYAAFMQMIEEDQNDLRNKGRKESQDSGFSGSEKSSTRNNSVFSENGTSVTTPLLYQITEEDKQGELWKQINTMNDPDDLARAVVSNISESALADLQVEDIDNFEMNPYEGGRMPTDGLVFEFTMDLDIPNV